MAGAMKGFVKGSTEIINASYELAKGEEIPEEPQAKPVLKVSLIPSFQGRSAPSAIVDNDDLATTNHAKMQIS